MSATRSVAKNTILLVGGMMFARVLALLLNKKMTGVLGTDGVGIWNLALSWTTILMVVARFGLNQLLTREVAKRPQMTLPLFWATLRVRWMVGALGYGFMVIFVYAAGYSELKQTVLLLTALAIFIEATSMACDSVLQAHDKVQYQTPGQIISALVFVGLAWHWLDAGHGVMSIVWANLIEKTLRLAIMAPLMVLRTGPWQWRDPEGTAPPRFMWLVKLGTPLFLSTTFGIIAIRVGTIMINSMADDAATGILSLGSKALDNMLIIPNLFATAMFPALMRYSQTENDDVQRLGERALRYLQCAVIPLTLLLTFTAGPIIHWLDDTDGQFNNSVLVMMIIIWGLPLQSATHVLNRLILGAERDRAFVSIGLAMMVVNIALNAILIPHYSYYGVAIATVASYLVAFVLHMRALNGTRFKPPILRAMFGPLAATAVAWGGTVLLLKFVVPSWGINWRYLPVDSGWTAFGVSVLVMFVFYLAALAGLRIVVREDYALLRTLKPNR